MRKRLLGLFTLFMALAFTACTIDIPTGNNSTTKPSTRPSGGGKNNNPSGGSSSGGNYDDSKFTNSTGKRGLCYNSLNEDEIRVLSNSNVKWVYNWGTHPSAREDELFQEYGILYIPMQWGNTTTQSLKELREYYTSHPDCKYILGFNEPNLGAGVGGSGIPPKQAAQGWKNIEDLAEEFDLEIVGPALQYSGDTLSDGKVYSTPESWMDSFISEFNKLYGRDPKYDYFCLHCYMNWPAAQEGYVKNYVKRYGKKVWLTEFCAWEYNNGGQNESAAAQKSSMIQKVNFLDSYAGADKYAWFMSSQHTNELPFNSLFTKVGSDGSLTTVGESYMYLGLDNAILLQRAITQAETLLSTAESGSLPGQYPAASVSALQNNVDSAKTAKESGNENSMKSAYDALSAAIKTFENAKIPYFTKSTTELNAEAFASSLTKNLAASAFTASSGTASLAFDGKTDTRWESAHEDNQWLKIDLGSKKEFNKISIKWEAAYSTSYVIEVSDDGSTWTTAMEEKNGAGGSETFNLTVTQNARYIRFFGKTRSTGYGHSFWEMGIFKN